MLRPTPIPLFPLFTRFILLLGLLPLAFAQSEIPLWPDGLDGPPSENGMSGEEGTGNCLNNVNEATITFYPAKKEAGVKGVDGMKRPAVLMIPGGGYGGVCRGTEGDVFAEFLAPRGMVTAVLKYRLPNTLGTGSCEIPGHDVLQALRTIRHVAEDYKIDKDQVGVWGFSAGGHLAATAANIGGPPDLDSEDLIQHESSKVNFAILFYPVISMKDGVTHPGSRRHLLGATPSAELIQQYSMETRVGKDHPPTFLLHAADDRPVPVENSLRYAAALSKAKVPFDLHVYRKGSHGPGAFKQNPHWETTLDAWFRRCGLLRE